MIVYKHTFSTRLRYIEPKSLKMRNSVSQGRRSGFVSTSPLSLGILSSLDSVSCFVLVYLVKPKKKGNKKKMPRYSVCKVGSLSYLADVSLTDEGLLHSYEVDIHVPSLHVFVSVTLLALVLPAV